MTVETAWIGAPAYEVGCVCQQMWRWCRAGRHDLCHCPHAAFDSAAAWLRRQDGSVVTGNDGRWWCLWIVPKPCQLHQACGCQCHGIDKPKPVRLVQAPLFELSA